MHNVADSEVESPTGHHDVVDARFPERWLNDTRITRLSGDAFKLFGLGLMFAVANKREGFLYEDDLDDIKRIDRSRVFELEQAGLWERDGNGWRLDEYAETQTSLAELEASARARVLARDRKVRQRKRERAEDDDAGLKSRVTSQARTGQARTGVEEGTSSRDGDTDESWPSPAPVGAGFDLADDVKDGKDWPVVSVPGQRQEPDPPQASPSFAIIERMKAETDRT